jgi:hypothetical protein
MNLVRNIDILGNFVKSRFEVENDKILIEFFNL